jgi:hypothetical protein
VSGGLLGKGYPLFEGEGKVFFRSCKNTDDGFIKEPGSPGGNIDVTIGYRVKAAGIESDNQDLASF